MRGGLGNKVTCMRIYLFFKCYIEVFILDKYKNVGYKFKLGVRISYKVFGYYLYIRIVRYREVGVCK